MAFFIQQIFKKVKKGSDTMQRKYYLVNFKCFTTQCQRKKRPKEFIVWFLHRAIFTFQCRMEANIFKLTHHRLRNISHIFHTKELL